MAAERMEKRERHRERERERKKVEGCQEPHIPFKGMSSTKPHP
jgi:hypothetical protein